MLSISKPIRAGRGEYYLALAAEDYYFSEAPGEWRGTAAEPLGLSGEVAPKHFRNLLLGRSPDGEEKLVRNSDKERRAAWDLTWSVPKSVSTAWSQAEPSVRLRIEKCVWASVEAGLSYLEQVAGWTRRGEDGRIKERARLTFAAFLHRTSRAHEPQLHIHTLLLNLALRDDGTTGTIETRGIFRHQHAADAIFRAELSARLERDLGLISLREGRAFELIGVSRTLMDAFSTRRAEIQEALREAGLTGSRASEIAALQTRRKKEPVLERELFERWERIGKEHRWGREELQELLNRPRKQRNFGHEVKEAVESALFRLTEAQSHFTPREVTAAVANEAQGRCLLASDVHAATQGIFRSPELLRLGIHRQEEHWTTRGILALEDDLLKACEELHAREVLITAAPMLAEAAAKAHPELSKEQRLALERLTEGVGGLKLVSGLAGTGKSTLFATARTVWEQEGLTTIGAALSGKAARELQNSTNIPSQTLHSLLHSLNRGILQLDSKSVVLIDEASMVGTRHLRDLARRCVSSGATLILAGDSKQLQAVELGGAFHELTERYGASRLTEIRRQKEEWARNAVVDLANGNAPRAMAAYMERGKVMEEEGREEAMKRLIHDWNGYIPEALILTSTNEDATELNLLAQKTRVSGGPLGPGNFHPGDRVLFTKNSPQLSVMNGDRGTVLRVEPECTVIKCDNGQTVRVHLESYPHLQLGYALTTHKAQGMTVESALVYLGGQTSRELAYVQGSRAKAETRWYMAEPITSTARAMMMARPKFLATSFDSWAQEEPELEMKR